MTLRTDIISNRRSILRIYLNTVHPTEHRKSSPRNGGLSVNGVDTSPFTVGLLVLDDQRHFISTFLREDEFSTLQEQGSLWKIENHCLKVFD